MLVLFLFLVTSQVDNTWINYTSFARVNDIKQDKQRLLTLSTGGISIENDGQFTIITNLDGLLSNDVNDVVLDDQYNVIAVTNQGISIFSPDITQNLNLTSYFHNIPHGTINSIIYQNDSIWVGAESGCWFWDTRGNPLNFSLANARKFLNGVYIHKLFLLDDSIFLGRVAQLTVIPYQNFDDTNYYQHWSKGLSASDTIYALDKLNDTVWISTNNGAAYLSGDSFIFTFNEYCPDLKNINDTIFIADYFGRRIRYLSGNNWVSISSQPPSRPTAISLDLEDRLGIGTEKEGSYYLANNSWVYCSPPSLWKEFVSSVAILPNGVIAAAHFPDADAISIRYPEGTWEYLTPVNDSTWGSPRFIEAFQDSAFAFGIYGHPGGIGIVYFNQDSAYLKKIRLPLSDETQPISCLYVDQENNIWCNSFLGTAPYILRYRYNTPPDTGWNSYFNSNYLYIYSMCRISDSQLAFGTAHFNANGFVAFLNINDSTSSSQLANLAGNDIMGISKGLGDTIWVASTGGINAVSVSNFTIVDTLTVTTTNGGLLDNSVLDVIYVPGNGLWALCENSGLSHRKLDGSWENFEHTAYLAGPPILDNRGGLFYQPDSQVIVAATSNGVTLHFIEVEDIELTEELIIYPNPWKNNSNLFISTGSEGTVYLYSLDGSLILEQSIPSTGICEIQSDQLENISSGLYFVIAKLDGVIKKGRLVIIK